jgi:hypothetical protein
MSAWLLHEKIGTPSHGRSGRFRTAARESAFQNGSLCFLPAARSPSGHSRKAAKRQERTPPAMPPIKMAKNRGAQCTSPFLSQSFGISGGKKTLKNFSPQMARRNMGGETKKLIRD